MKDFSIVTAGLRGDAVPPEDGDPLAATPPGDTVHLTDLASLARHLAFSPAAFAVTEGPTHLLRYSNTAFRRLEVDGGISIGQPPPGGLQRTSSLGPLLDRAFTAGETIHDELLAPVGGALVSRWSCTVWPIASETPVPEGLVFEVRDTAYVEGAIIRQRAVAEKLLLSALRAQDSAQLAGEATDRAAFLSAASRDLAVSLDQDTTREVVRRRTLPRDGTWCIVDIIESNGAIHRLAVVHPDPEKQALAGTLAEHWFPKPDAPITQRRASRPVIIGPAVITHESGAARLAAAHGPQNLAILEALGFGTLLVIPLAVRGTPLGAITFVSREGDAPFTPEEITLASELADRCATALDNARLYRESDILRESADTANRAKSQFIGTMSHELRTPLNAIGGYAELMEMGLRGPVTAEQRTDLTRIKHNQEHLLELISEILNFVRTESAAWNTASARCRSSRRWGTSSTCWIAPSRSDSSPSTFGRARSTWPSGPTGIAFVKSS